MSNARLAVIASVLFSVGLAVIPAQAKRGPFPVTLSHIDNMTFVYLKVLEKPTQALYLASHDPEKLKHTDGVLTLENDVVVKMKVLDPATGLPQVDAAGKPVLVRTTLAAKTVLNPLVNPLDDVLLPKGAKITLVALADGDFPIGRFGYLGVAPRFDSKNLEMFASKMGHTLRVKGYVTREMLDNYEFTLLDRFNSYATMFADETIHLERLRDFDDLAQSAPTSDLRKWYGVAKIYSKHLFETVGLDIYQEPLSEADYKRLILTRMIQTYLQDPSATVESSQALYAEYKALRAPKVPAAKIQAFLESRREISTALFRAHFKETFVEGAPAAATYPIEPAPESSPTPVPSGIASPTPAPVPSPAPKVDPHADALGFVTFVYPIAIDREGPFKLPSPGLRHFPLRGSIEGRRFSNRWR